MFDPTRAMIRFWVRVLWVSGSSSEPSRFDRDTALVLEGDVLRGTLSEDWRAAGGPHGGYVAALILRGLMIVNDDARRSPLTLTVQFVREATFGDVELEASVERVGRSLTSFSARLRQGEDVVALALATFGVSLSGVEYDELPMPHVEAPWPDRRSVISDQAPRFVRNMVLQPRFGRPFESRADPMVAGGWGALPGRRPLDASAVALFTDAWFPPPYVRLDRFVPSPTVTLSIYFRQRLPRALTEDDDLCLGRFQTRLVNHGCFESAGTLWAPDGTVLAQSHQLQLLFTD